MRYLVIKQDMSKLLFFLASITVYLVFRIMQKRSSMKIMLI